jgi:hypothetical protein
MRVVTTPADEGLGDHAYGGAVSWTCLESHGLDVGVAPGQQVSFDGGTWAAAVLPDRTFASVGRRRSSYSRVRGQSQVHWCNLDRDWNRHRSSGQEAEP